MSAFWLVLLLAMAVTLLMPWTVTRRVLIPLGMPRAARRLAALSAWAWGNDARGGGLVAAAWAVLRQAEPDPADIEWIESARDRWIERIRDQEPRIRASQVLVTGLLAAARGDLDGARMLLASVTDLGPRTTPRTVRALAREWLAADAAARGAWDQVIRHASGPRVRNRSLRLLLAVGTRLAGRSGAPHVAVLWLLWLHAPHRRHTLALVRRAADAPVPAAPEPDVPGSPDSPDADPSSTAAEGGGGAPVLHPDAHQHALRAHVAALRREDGEAAVAARTRAIHDLAHAWDEALAAPETRRMILERAAALGARSGNAALRTLEDTVARDLADMVREAGIPMDARAIESRLLREAARLLREELMNEIELAFDALHRRVEADRRLAPIDEWREWLSLRALHAAAVAVGGIELRRMVFPHVHQVACKHAVWLWNQRAQHLMANAMFHWLLGEAMIVGDTEAIELQRRNWEDQY